MTHGCLIVESDIEGFLSIVIPDGAQRRSGTHARTPVLLIRSQQQVERQGFADPGARTCGAPPGCDNSEVSTRMNLIAAHESAANSLFPPPRGEGWRGTFLHAPDLLRHRVDAGQTPA